MVSSRVRIVAAVVVLLGLLGASCTGSSAPTVKDAWVRAAMSADATAAGYLVITGGSAADALLGASSPQAMSVELHETSTDAQGMTGMKPVDRLAVPSGATVTLAPGGFHLMIMGLSKPLEVGQKLELQLRFEHAGTVVVQAEVRAS